MFEKKRRMMMGDNSQDKPQERQLESDKKEVASSVTDSKDPTPKFSSPVKRAPKEKPKEDQSVDSADEFVNAEDSKKDEGRYFLYDMLTGMFKELYSAIYNKVGGWSNEILDAVEKVRNRMDGYDLDAIRRHKEVETMLGEIKTIVEHLAETGTDDSSNNSSALRREDLPNTGYCYYNSESGKWGFTFLKDKAYECIGVSGGKPFVLPIPWEELFGQEEEKYYF